MLVLVLLSLPSCRPHTQIVLYRIWLRTVLCLVLVVLHLPVRPTNGLSCIWFGLHPNPRTGWFVLIDWLFVGGFSSRPDCPVSDGMSGPTLSNPAPFCLPFPSLGTYL